MHAPAHGGQSWGGRSRGSHDSHGQPFAYCMYNALDSPGRFGYQ